MKEPINSYRDLKVWRDAMALAEACDMLTRAFPREEMFGLTSQIRRSSSSIAANIAEGHGREGTRPFIQHLRIVQGSLKELETHLLLSARVKIVSQDKIASPMANCQEIGRMIRSLIRQLEKRIG